MSERLYHSDPFLASFTARVSNIREVSRNQNGSQWQIALDRTAFYPTSGGQPHDIGVMAAEAPSGAKLEAPITEVTEDDQGEIWHTTTKPLAAGTEVRCRIDWNRRLDHMQQHSGQHLLSAVFRRQLKAFTLSFHMGESLSTIDLGIESVSQEDLERVADEANRIIAENRPVAVRTVDEGKASELLSAGALVKLPDRRGDIRLVEIEEFDLNACGGTHVRFTGQIGSLLIRGTQRARQGLRVEFACGLRAAAAARADFSVLQETSASLSVGSADLPAAVSRVLAENKLLHKEQQKLTEDLADYHAARLVVEVPIEAGLRIVRRTFSERSGDYIKLLASRITSAAPHSVAVLASTAQEPAKIVMACSQDLELNCGAMLRNAVSPLGGRGGGTAGRAQGEVAATNLEAVFAAIEASIEEAHSPD